MIIELRGVNTRNKGAELMLRAVEQHFRGRHQVAVDPRAGSYVERARLGLLQKVVHPKVPDKALGRVVGILPGKARTELSLYGLVTDADVGAVLDASGFAYSDQFEPKRSETAAAKAELTKAAGKPYVLLPQAFGPFENPQRRSAFVRLANSSAKVYAREQRSLDYVLGSGCRTDHVSLSPDFTNLLAGTLPSDFEAGERLALIVPSAKLLTETAPEVQAAYLPFMQRAVEHLLGQGFDVRMVLHELNDTDTIETLQQRLTAPLPVVAYPDPLDLKGVIGQASVVVGSRFHALVSALSQGVPALGVGWSHKYEMLFGDYGVARFVVDPRAEDDALTSALDELTSASDDLRDGLRRAADDERRRSSAMWAEVDALLERAG